jgi:hypothetical protein
MNILNRRQALILATGVVSGSVLGSGHAVAQNCEEKRVSDSPDAQTWADERAKVVSIGFTEAEADCWELAARTAGKFFELPELHELDAREVAQAIHVIQNKLMSRPAYRRYLGRRAQ